MNIHSVLGEQREQREECETGAQRRELRRSAASRPLARSWGDHHGAARLPASSDASSSLESHRSNADSS